MNRNIGPLRKCGKAKGDLSREEVDRPYSHPIKGKNRIDFTMTKKKRATDQNGATSTTTSETPKNGTEPTESTIPQEPETAKDATLEQQGVTLTPEEMKILGAWRKAKEDPEADETKGFFVRAMESWVEILDKTPEDWAAEFAPPPPIGDLNETEEEVIRQFRYRHHTSGPFYRPQTDARVAKRDLADPTHRRAWMLLGHLIEAGFIEMPNLDVEGGHLGMFELIDRAEQLHSDVMSLVWVLDHLDPDEQA